VHAMSELKAVLPQADFVALTCQLTEETEKVIDADALGRIKPSAERANSVDPGLTAGWLFEALHLPFAKRATASACPSANCRAAQGA
jgi:hypothetical protein